MTLKSPKTGKFAPTCKSCKTRFQLLIKQNEDGKFRYKTGPLPASKSGGQRPTPDGEKSQPGSQRPDQPASKTSADLEETEFQSGTNVESKKPDRPKTRRPKSASQGASVEPAGETALDAGIDGDTHQNKSSTSVNKQRSTGAATPNISRLGPYRILGLLGEGGMGSVYLANQTSLDRNVALKVVKSKLSKNKSMLARFTREAYAAAQLVHPNVVQIYDMGDDRGNCFFSMELVDGQSLLELVKKQKRIDPEQATSFILHAARGLQCAHNAGMVHRDIKPANLLVNRDGLVKVADLGLVKVSDKEEIESDIDDAVALSASQDLTRAGSTLGTPYYMAPEQAKSSIDVDHRADIYSLGCTFYVLLTGKKPFEGSSLQEVASKHSSAPLVVPSKLVERVPEELSVIVARMMEKRPDDRYQTMDELITELENFLGISSTAAFTPSEQDANTIEQCASSFNSIALTKLRGLIPLALVAGSMLLAFLMLFVGWKWATGFLLLPIAAVVSYFIVSGVRETPVLFARVRELVIRSGPLSWLKWIAAGMLLVVASFMVGAFFHWVILGALGAGLGAAFYFLIDMPIANSRQPSTKDAELLLRRMRLKGMDESTVQMFVAKYSGSDWEEFFESLFGYGAKRRIRDELGKSNIGKKKPKFRAWRDVIADHLQARIDALNSEDDQKHLQKIEQAGLVEQGVSVSDAKEQAAQMALALVDHGGSIRVAALEKRIAELDPEAKRIQQRLKVKSMLAEARSGRYRKPPSMMQRLSPVLNRSLGAYPRFLLGCCLIVGCLMWANQNDLFSVEDLKQTAAQATNTLTGEGASISIDDGDAKTAAIELAANLKDQLNKETEPLKFPILGSVFYNFNALIAGLILACSAVVFGWRIALFVIPAAIITLWGASLGIPELIVVKHLHPLSALIGIGLLVVGILFGRSGK